MARCDWFHRLLASKCTIIEFLLDEEMKGNESQDEEGKCTFLRSVQGVCVCTRVYVGMFE